MKYDFDRNIDRKNTQSMKWKKDGILPLWVADMDFECPDPIVKAVKDRADTLIYGYTLIPDDYYSIVSDWFKRRYDWEVEKNNIFYSPGIMASVGYLIRALTKKGQGIIIQPPVYHQFKSIIEANQRKVCFNTLINKQGKYHIDFEDLEKKAAENENKMLLFCCPHNPVGRVWSVGELSEVVRICQRNDVIIVSDEIHSDIIRKSETFIPLDKAMASEKIITLSAPSKTFNIPGLMFSNVVINNKDYIRLWEDEAYHRTGFSLPNPFGYSAAVAAYTKCDDWLSQVNSYIDDNLNFIDDFLKKNLPDINYRVPEGTYLAWLDFNVYGLSEDELDKWIYKKASVWLNKGTEFHDGATGFRRLNAACPRGIIKNALESIKAASGNCL